MVCGGYCRSAGCLHSVRVLQNKHKEGAGGGTGCKQELWCGCTSLGGQGRGSGLVPHEFPGQRGTEQKWFHGLGVVSSVGRGQQGGEAVVCQLWTPQTVPQKWQHGQVSARIPEPVPGLSHSGVVSLSPWAVSQPAGPCTAPQTVTLSCTTFLHLRSSY